MSWKGWCGPERVQWSTDFAGRIWLLEYKGEKRLFVQHLRISNEQGAKGMRIYFCVDGEEKKKKIVVAYVGSHLSNFSTN